MPPDVKYDSSTPGKLEPIHPQDQMLVSYTNKPMNSTPKHPYIAKPPVIKWDDDGDYLMPDELSRIAKVCPRTSVSSRNVLSTF
jgi:hypothetical protein